ncbi:hypothetical protein [Kitasatospora atroaurantiaca]|nr:hypothetical protein [Kitasatospora atroaurantiaca]
MFGDLGMTVELLGLVFGGPGVFLGVGRLVPQPVGVETKLLQ